MQDPAIRKALAYGIDRESFAQTVYLGQAVTAYGLISPRFKLYYQDLSKDPNIAYNFDPAKAKEILKDGRLELLDHAVHEERRQGRVRARDAVRQRARTSRWPSERPPTRASSAS